MTSCCWMTRSSLGCKFSGISATSSRNSVPPWAERTMPSMFCSAPVNAPRTWPKNWLSNSEGLIPAQLTGMKGRFLRRLFAQSLRAKSSLPVPLSPSISTQQSLGATLSTSLRTSQIACDLPTICGRSISDRGNRLIAVTDPRSSQDSMPATLSGRSHPPQKSPTRGLFSYRLPATPCQTARLAAGCVPYVSSGKAAAFAASGNDHPTPESSPAQNLIITLPHRSINISGISITSMTWQTVGENSRASLGKTLSGSRRCQTTGGFKQRGTRPERPCRPRTIRSSRRPARDHLGSTPRLGRGRCRCTAGQSGHENDSPAAP